MNIEVEINLAVGKINFVLPNFNPSTFNTCIKHAKCLQYNIKAHYSNSANTMSCPSTSSR